MSDKRKILIQLDTDAQPSVFDRVVAVDAGAGVVVHVEETWADHAVLSSMDEQHRNDRMPQ